MADVLIPQIIPLKPGQQRQLADVRTAFTVAQRRCQELEQAIVQAVLYGADLTDLTTIRVEITDTALHVSPKETATEETPNVDPPGESH